MAQTQINGSTQIQSATITQTQLNVATPTTSGQVATKGYVDGVAQGLSTKTSAVAATVGTETYTIVSGSVTVINGTTLDGQSPAVNDPILIKDAPASSGTGSVGSTQPGNGLYIVTNATTNLTVSRAADMSGATNLPAGAYVYVEGGTANGSSGWVVSVPSTSAAFTYGTNNIKWTQFSGAGEITVDATITKTGNQLSRPALTGDVTASTGSNATTIAAGAVTLAKIASAAYNTTPAATILAEWDANSNLSANNFLGGFTTTATAGTTTTLTIATATEIMVWTGSTTQTVKLPTTGIAAGTQFTIINQSSANVSVQSSGANAILALAGAASAPFAAAVFTALVATPTTAAQWSYSSFATGAGSGTVTSVSVVTANGFQGSVATATSTPAITIQTSLSAGLIKSNGSNAFASAATSDIVAGYVVRETPTGTINGSNTSFTLANTPVSGTEMLFQNGILLVAGSGKDYTISSGTVTFVTPPASGDVLLATYWH